MTKACILTLSFFGSLSTIRLAAQFRVLPKIEVIKAHPTGLSNLSIYAESQDYYSTILSLLLFPYYMHGTASSEL